MSVLEGYGKSKSHSAVGCWKVLAVVVLFAAYAAVDFWKVLAVETNHKKQLKTPHGFHVFSPISLRYVSLLFFCISFVQVLRFLVFCLV